MMPATAKRPLVAADLANPPQRKHPQEQEDRPVLEQQQEQGGLNYRLGGCGL